MTSMRYLIPLFCLLSTCLFAQNQPKCDSLFLKNGQVLLVEIVKKTATETRFSYCGSTDEKVLVLDNQDITACKSAVNHDKIIKEQIDNILLSRPKPVKIRRPPNKEGAGIFKFPRKQFLGVNLPVFGTFRTMYARTILPYYAVSLEVDLVHRNKTSSHQGFFGGGGYTQNKKKGFGLHLENRIYPVKNSLNGVCLILGYEYRKENRQSLGDYYDLVLFGDTLSTYYDRQAEVQVTRALLGFGYTLSYKHFTVDIQTLGRFKTHIKYLSNKNNYEYMPRRATVKVVLGYNF